MARKKKPRPAPAPQPDVGTSLGALLGAAGLQASPEPATPAAPEAQPSQADPDPLDLSRCRRIHVRQERKGRGGRTVTVIGGLPAERLQPVARAMGRALGTGARVEGETVVVQGKIADRARAWLLAQGAPRVRG